jgi:hypothetical protein
MAKILGVPIIDLDHHVQAVPGRPSGGTYRF